MLDFIQNQQVSKCIWIPIQITNSDVRNQLYIYNFGGMKRLHSKKNIY